MNVTEIIPALNTQPTTTGAWVGKAALVTTIAGGTLGCAGLGVATLFVSQLAVLSGGPMMITMALTTVVAGGYLITNGVSSLIKMDKKVSATLKEQVLDFAKQVGMVAGILLVVIGANALLIHFIPGSAVIALPTQLTTSSLTALVALLFFANEFPFSIEREEEEEEEEIDFFDQEPETIKEDKLLLAKEYEKRVHENRKKQKALREQFGEEAERDKETARKALLDVVEGSIALEEAIEKGGGTSNPDRVAALQLLQTQITDSEDGDVFVDVVDDVIEQSRQVEASAGVVQREAEEDDYDARLVVHGEALTALISQLEPCDLLLEDLSLEALRDEQRQLGELRTRDEKYNFLLNINREFLGKMQDELTEDRRKFAFNMQFGRYSEMIIDLAEGVKEETKQATIAPVLFTICERVLELMELMGEEATQYNPGFNLKATKRKLSELKSAEECDYAALSELAWKISDAGDLAKPS